MVQSTIKFLTKSNTGRFILVGLVIVGVGYGARLYYVDLPAMQEKSARSEGADRLEALAEALEDVDPVRPGVSAWYPAALPCGVVQPFGAPSEPFWGQLDIDPAQKTAFQYRYDASDAGFRLIARRDADCDGHYAVWTYEDGAVTGQNTKE